MAFYTLDLQFYQKKMGKKKKGDDSLLRKKKQKKSKTADIMISVDGKKTVFPVKLKLQGESFE